MCVGDSVNDLLAIRSSRQSGDLLDGVHDQELADGVVGLGIPKPAWPILFAAHLSKYAVLPLRPFSQYVDVRVEMLARGEEDNMGWRGSLVPGSTHPPEQEQADECGADGVDLDCSLPESIVRARQTSI
jgi:hypothetical protein